MGQKTNPNIFQLGINKEWDVKFSEITNEEHTLYNYHNIEIKNFIKKFFKDLGLNVHSIKIGYAQKYLYIYISYYFTEEFFNICGNGKNFKKIIKNFPLKKSPSRGRMKNFEECNHNRISNQRGRNYFRWLLLTECKISDEKLSRRFYPLKKYPIKNRSTFSSKYKIIVTHLLNIKEKWVINAGINDRCNKIFSENQEILKKSLDSKEVSLRHQLKSEGNFVKLKSSIKVLSQFRRKYFSFKKCKRKYFLLIEYFLIKTRFLKALYMKETAVEERHLFNKVLKILHPFTKTKYKKVFNDILIARKKKIKEIERRINSQKIKQKKSFDGEVSESLFLNKLLETLTAFTKDKFNIKIISQHVNKGITKKLSRKDKFKLKKKLVLLRQYSRQDFFETGVSTALTFLIINNSANILAEYIFKYIRKLKRHNFFLVFLKRMLNHFIVLDFCKMKGVKINIKGRFNGRPRSRMRSILAGNVAVQSFNRKVNYLEKTIYTKDGTFGVKIWVNN